MFFELTPTEADTEVLLTGNYIKNMMAHTKKCHFKRWAPSTSLQSIIVRKTEAFIAPDDSIWTEFHGFVRIEIGLQVLSDFEDRSNR